MVDIQKQANYLRPFEKESYSNKLVQILITGPGTSAVHILGKNLVDNTGNWNGFSWSHVEGSTEFVGGNEAEYVKNILNLGSEEEIYSVLKEAFIRAVTLGREQFNFLYSLGGKPSLRVVVWV